MCVFPDVYLSYDVPGLKKKDPKKSSKQGKTGSGKKDVKEKKANNETDNVPPPQARGLVGKAKRYA
jgi:hypothetical protein